MCVLMCDVIRQRAWCDIYDPVFRSELKHIYSRSRITAVHCTLYIVFEIQSVQGFFLHFYDNCVIVREN